MTTVEMIKAIGWTQERLGRALDVSVVTINRWANGKNKPHRVFARELEHIYNKEVKS